jgi:hypothetical protein
MSSTGFDEATRDFWDKITSSDKIAVDLSVALRRSLGVSQEPEALDELEAAASGASDVDPALQLPSSSPAAEGAGDPPHVAPPLPASEVARASEEAESEAPIQAIDSPAESELSSDAEDSSAEGAIPAAPDRTTDGHLFSARSAHPLRLRDVLQAKYGDEWLAWEPETLWWAIRRDFGSLSELARNKIHALRLAVKSYAPWCDWDTFEKCGLAWNDSVPLFGAYQPMAPSQVAFTIEVLKALHADATPEHEVAAYEAMILDENGFVYAPAEWFPGAQALLDRKSEGAPLKARVEQAWEHLKERDLSSVEWRAGDPVDLHVAKLYVVRSYLDGRAALRDSDASAPRRSTQSQPTSPPVP